MRIFQLHTEFNMILTFLLYCASSISSVIVVKANQEGKVAAREPGPSRAKEARGHIAKRGPQ